ncbi:MAG: endonuclease [Defluviitaleaceae bacterium]|nr:endonuclease [Defluviitaleaceae bacterium]
MNILEIYDALFSRYGDLNWWPANSAYEVIVGAVLTQNTNWGNVEKAIANFDNLTPEFVRDAEISEISEIIKPSGFFNQKAVYLKAVTAWFEKYNFDVSAVRLQPLERLRPEILAVKGIGKETADSILLYAFGFPTFVIDAYTARLCSRYPVDAGNGYDALKLHFETNIQNSEIYNNFHAMIVMNAKEHCRKKPLCNNCPLNAGCRKII